MLDTILLDNILFLDIETVPEQPAYESLDSRMAKLWDKKSERIRQMESDTPGSLYMRAGIYAEFGKIICISVGSFRKEEFRIKSFADEDERVLLSNFAQMLTTYFNRQEHLLCAHNGKEFDFPFIARRMLVNGVRIPSILDLSGKKPWEVNHLDTMELWKFGDFKNYTSLDLLAAIFNIQTPKDDIDGSMVGKVYWEEHDLKRIISYCCKDVLTVAQIIRRYRGEPLIPDEKVVITDA
ncbi:MAG: 3'-5' exonuclease [Bacteroidetes bacterium]|nr:3'-5' exonuclease [Bacteroidota bacterium]